MFIFLEVNGVHTLIHINQMYNKITNNFRNWLPLLVLTCWQCDDKLNVGFIFFDECIFALIVDSHWHVLFLNLLSNKYKIKVGYAVKVNYSYLVLSNDVFDQKLDNVLYILLWLIRKLWEKWWEMTHKEHLGQV